MSRIKIKQAAEILGVSEKTIRRRISKGQIQATKGKTPQGFIYLIDVNDDINSTSHDSTKFKNEANESNPPNNILDMELLKKQFDYWGMRSYRFSPEIKIKLIIPVIETI